MSTKNPLVAAEAAVAEREDALEAAVGDGRLLAASVADWRSRWIRDPAGTKATLARLAPGLPPVSGGDTFPELSAEDEAEAAAAIAKGWFGVGKST